MIVGLTGSIATGKSTVSKMLAEHGAVIIDADKIVRRVQEPGQPAWRGIVEHFGEGVLQEDGTLDRAKLGDLVFQDSTNRQRLNEIVHPIVREERDRETAQARERDSQAIIIWDIPLLIETGIYKDVDRVVVVYVDQETQLSRLLSRDELSEEQAKARIDAQMPIEEKKAYADYLIDNRGTLEETAEQVRRVYEQLRELAAQERTE
ncbi:dephospho-CoA kinase [Tumebacillus sp. DT12]|uniref:Dephospho-CoA kinase n=1 Tax=Tumebacillus lacus TaxID=2995335 RepID=A0ABT3X1B3_9BACL|nr:dephospho-CoA kinase [Tumebacillus lacus]MCX7570688.1 dephospho-CoA kinase [Tumebacillus lacus]